MRVGMETFIARAADTGTRRQDRSLASVGSSSVCKRGKIEDVDNSRVRPVCGQFVSAAEACSRTVETGTCSRMRPGCDRACVGGLNADMDCSRTRTNRVPGLFPTGPRSWTCRRCSYRLPRMQKGKRSMTRCLTGSYCWDRDRRRLKRKRPGILPYTGSLPQHNHPRKYAFLSRSPTEMSEIKLPERLHIQRKYAVGYMRVQGRLRNGEAPIPVVARTCSPIGESGLLSAYECATSHRRTGV